MASKTTGALLLKAQEILNSQHPKTLCDLKVEIRIGRVNERATRYSIESKMAVEEFAT